MRIEEKHSEKLTLPLAALMSSCTPLKDAMFCLLPRHSMTLSNSIT
jgi:hypothetical protein